MDRNALLLRRQARQAARAGRPVAWLALVLWAAEQTDQDGKRPKGSSRNTGRIAAILVASGDYRSGRRARPGRQIVAALVDCAERTVERQWRLLERLGLAERTVDGRWLTASEREAVYADAGETNRWRDRQEWHLVLPTWARDVDADQLAPYDERARLLLAELAYGQPVDNRPGGAGDVVLRRGRVAPSTGSFCSRTWLPVRGGWVLRRCAPDKRRAASRRSPTRSPDSGTSDRRRRGPPTQATVLARQLADSGRFPWLRRAPRYLVASVLRRFEGWTVRDVELAAHTRIRAATFTYPAQIDRPHAWLRWLLAEADPARPPAAELHAAERAESVARREHTARMRQDGPTPRQRAWDAHAEQVAAERAARAAGRGWAIADRPAPAEAAQRVAERASARQAERLQAITEARARMDEARAARAAGVADAGETEQASAEAAAAAARSAEQASAEIRARAILRARRERHRARTNGADDHPNR